MYLGSCVYISAEEIGRGWTAKVKGKGQVSRSYIFRSLPNRVPPTCTSNTSAPVSLKLNGTVTSDLKQSFWVKCQGHMNLFEKSLSNHNCIFLPMILSGSYISIEIAC